MSKEPQRIAKLLARAGIASRREIERMIEARRIALDGVPLETAATILTSLHGVTVDGNPVEAPAPARLFRFHKPAGLLTAERDPKGRPTIYDRLPAGLPRVVPVGRLDLATEGLLLLTTDGELKRQLELPSTGIERSYRARAYGNVSQSQLEDLIEGIEIEGVRYGSIDANLERRTGANTWIEMKLTEGKNREVRRVLEHLGLQVSRLIRTAYGPFALDDLPMGAVDEIRQHDLVAFRQWLSGKAVPGAAAAGPPRIERTGRPAAVRPNRPRSDAGRPSSPRPVRPARPDPAKRPPATMPAIGKRPARPGLAKSERPRSAPAIKAPAEAATSPARPAKTKVDRTGWAKPKPPRPGSGKAAKRKTPPRRP